MTVINSPHSGCEPASSILERCGKVAEVAKRLRRHRTTVSRWTQPPDEGGTGGWIPLEYHADLIAMAAEKGIVIERREFLPASSQAA